MIIYVLSNEIGITKTKSILLQEELLNKIAESIPKALTTPRHFLEDF